MVKNMSADAGDAGNVGSIPGSGRSLRVGYGNPLQHSCLENPMDKEAWQATVHGIAKNSTGLSDLPFHLGLLTCPLLCLRLSLASLPHPGASQVAQC